MKTKASQPAKEFHDYMGHEYTRIYRAQQHARHFSKPGRTSIQSYLLSKKSISILLSHLCLGLTRGLQGTQEISLLESSVLQLCGGIHDTDCQSLSIVYYMCTSG